MNYKSDFFYNIYHEDFQADRAVSQIKDEAVIFIHGYPGKREDKNRDLVTLSETYDTYLMHHQGLGKSKGKFSFSEAVETTHQFYDFILAKGYSRVHLVGHSWGGFVSLSMLEIVSSCSGKMILLSPFLKIASGEKLKAVARSLHTNSFDYVGHLSQEEIEADLSTLSEKNNFEHFQKRLLSAPSMEVHLVQAINDDETPVETAREFVKRLPTIHYQELDTDHGFENCRPYLKKLIHEILL